MEQQLEALTTSVIVFLPRMLAGLGVVIAAWIGAIVIDAIVGRIGQRGRLDASVLHLLQRCARMGLLVFGVVTALGTVGVDVSALVAGLGLTGFALGFALKDVLSNVLAGVLILLYRPFVRHDRVAVAGYEGTVTEIDLRYTTLEQGDSRFLIPNSTLFTNGISVTRPGARAERPEITRAS